MTKPICKICESEGRKYSVTMSNFGTTTLMGIIPAYWDEDGIYHDSIDPNKTTFHHHCSNGHLITEII